jgi:long-chain acyl-CoA synthetase
LVTLYQWFLLDFGCLLQGIVVVAIHTAFESDDVEFIIRQANIKAVVCSEDLLPKFRPLSNKCDTLDFIITFSPLKGKGSVRYTLSKALFLVCSNGVTVSQLEEAGKVNPSEIELLEPTDIATIIYTSGSTGRPKGMF